MKVCAACKVAKQVTDFYRHTRRRDGLSSYCKRCQKSYKARYYRQNKARLDEENREYVRANVASVGEYRKEWNQAAYINSVRKQLSTKLRSGLKRRPTENPMTLDDLVKMYERQSGKCLLTGIQMTRLGGKTLATSISIDRIESAKGYTPDNVRLICHAVNAFKGAWSDELMLDTAEALLRANRPNVLREEKPRGT